MQDSLPTAAASETIGDTSAEAAKRQGNSRFRWSDLHGSSLLGANAVVSRELRVALRNERAFATLAIYVAILGAVVASQFPSEASVALTTSRNTGAAALGFGLFCWFGWSQALLIVLLLPALATGALSQERERRTLEPLLLTPLTPLQIVWGKGVGVLAFAALLLLSTVPLTALCFLLGGVSPGDVIGVYCCLLGLAACVTALGLGCSAKWENTTQATLMCYLLVPLAVAVLVVGSGPGVVAAGLNLFWRSLSGVAAWWKKPHRLVPQRLQGVWQMSLAFVMPVLFALEIYIVAAGWDWGIFWIVFALPYLLLVSQMTMKWAADEIARHPEPRLPTPERVASWKAEWAHAVEPPPAVYLPTATGKYSYSPPVPVAPPTRLVPATYGVKAFLPDGRNPIFMRDMRSGLLGKWSYLFRYSYIVVILSEIVMLLWLLSPSMNLHDWIDGFASLASVHLLLLMAGGAVFGARALAPEREQQTLPQLLTTPLLPRDIIGGKIMTVAVYTFYIWVLAVPGALLLAILQIVPFASIASFLGLELVFGAFAMAWGLFCSMRALTVRRALGWALGGVGALVMASAVVRAFGLSLQPSLQSNAPSTPIDILSAWLPLSAMDNAIRYWAPTSVSGLGAPVSGAPVLGALGAASSQALLWVGFSALFFTLGTLFLLAKTAGDFRRYLQEI